MTPRPSSPRRGWCSPSRPCEFGSAPGGPTRSSSTQPTRRRRCCRPSRRASGPWSRAEPGQCRSRVSTRYRPPMRSAPRPRLDARVAGGGPAGAAHRRPGGVGRLDAEPGRTRGPAARSATGRHRRDRADPTGRATRPHSGRAAEAAVGVDPSAARSHPRRAPSCRPPPVRGRAAVDQPAGGREAPAPSTRCWPAVCAPGCCGCPWARWSQRWWRRSARSPAFRHRAAVFQGILRSRAMDRFST